MNLSCYWRQAPTKLILFITPLLLLWMSPVPLCAMDSVGMSMEQIQRPEFLKEIAHTILGRNREKTRLKEKLCKHDEIMIDVWKSGKKWGELDQGLQKSLTKHVPKSQVQSILKRTRHSVMNPEILADPEGIAQVIIEKGSPILRLIGQSGEEYAIKISYDISPQIAGTIFVKTESEIKPIPETRIYISFNVTDIVNKLMKSGMPGWNREMDGEVTTLCVDE